MNAELGLTMTIVVSLGLSTMLVQVLKAPLRQVINVLCTSGEATQFWVSFTSVMLFISPLFFALFTFDPAPRFPAAWVLRSTLLATLFGASVALLVVGIKIASSSPKAGDRAAH
jgi:hypothetical protein